MTLQDGYLVAGIVVAAVAVISLILKLRGKSSSANRQGAKVSGQNNSVTQNSNISAGRNNEER